MIFRGIWAVVKGWIDPTTACKVSIHGSDANENIATLRSAGLTDKNIPRWVIEPGKIKASKGADKEAEDFSDGTVVFCEMLEFQRRSSSGSTAVNKCVGESEDEGDKVEAEATGMSQSGMPAEKMIQLFPEVFEVEVQTRGSDKMPANAS